jgi:histone-lysine N-methyltransferase SUV39H
VKNGDIKGKSVIKHGTFIIEYTGELLGHHEASKRRITSYLFDLNMERRQDGYYTIDAFKSGNLARFVNHSCDPNASIWFVNDCRKDPTKQ